MEKQQTNKFPDDSNSSKKRKRLLLMILLYLSLLYVYFPLVLKFQDELSNSPMLNFLGGILSFIVLLVGGILGGLSGFVTGDFYFCKLCGDLLPWDSSDLRIVLGPLAVISVPILFYLKALRRPSLMKRVDLFLHWWALIVFPALICLMAFLLKK